MFNFQFRLVRFSAILFLLNSCIRTEVNLNQEYSKTQQDLFHLVDNYKAEYLAAANEVNKDSVQNKYLLAFESLLDDSLGKKIDSVFVIVDTVIEKDRVLTTQFHTKEIDIYYSMKFNDKMDSFNNVVYHRITNLRPRSEIMLNFIKLGGIELNSPDKARRQIVRIFAFPVLP